MRYFKVPPGCVSEAFLGVATARVFVVLYEDHLFLFPHRKAWTERQVSDPKCPPPLPLPSP